MKTKFLKLIRNAMQVVVYLDKELDMDTFFRYPGKIRKIEDEETTIRNCGTPACVAGYASIYSEVLHYFTESGHDIEDRTISLPNSVWYALEEETSIKLADSLFACDAKSRSDSFKNFQIDYCVDAFGPLPKHLTTENPSAKDALDYIDYLIETIEKLPS